MKRFITYRINNRGKASVIFYGVVMKDSKRTAERSEVKNMPVACFSPL
jgi:hypothetical protein